MFTNKIKPSKNPRSSNNFGHWMYILIASKEFIHCPQSIYSRPDSFMFRHYKLFLMNLSGSEKLLLVQKKEEIRTLTQEIIEIINKESTTNQDFVDVEKKFLQILSIIHVISSYQKPNRDLQVLMKEVLDIFSFHLQNKNTVMMKSQIATLCVVVNSIQFSFSSWPFLFKAKLP